MSKTEPQRMREIIDSLQNLNESHGQFTDTLMDKLGSMKFSEEEIDSACDEMTGILSAQTDLDEDSAKEFLESDEAAKLADKVARLVQTGTDLNDAMRKIASSQDAKMAVSRFEFDSGRKDIP